MCAGRGGKGRSVVLDVGLCVHLVCSGSAGNDRNDKKGEKLISKECTANY